MTNSSLPIDNKGNAIPAMTLRRNGAHSISFNTSTATRNTSPFHRQTQVISLYLTQDAYIELGDSAVEATSSSHFFPAGVYYDFSLGGSEAQYLAAGAQNNIEKYISVLAVSADGTAYISEKE